MRQEYAELIRRAAAKRILFLPHAIKQMIRPERMISTSEVRKAIYEGQVIEHYPEDPRGPSCLVLGFGEGGRPLHVVYAPKDEYLAIITAYLPSSEEWEEDFKTRKMK